MNNMDLAYMFWSNGWKSEFEKARDFTEDGIFPIYSVYSSVFTSEWEMDVYVYVSSSYLGVNSEGYIGVSWIAVNYNKEDRDDTEFAWEDAMNFQATIEMVEDHLLKIGIPFVSSYRFHGKNRANKKRRNDSLIRKLDVKAYEDECWKEIRKENEKKFGKIREEQEDAD